MALIGKEAREGEGQRLWIGSVLTGMCSICLSCLGVQSLSGNESRRPLP